LLQVFKIIQTAEWKEYRITTHIQIKSSWQKHWKYVTQTGFWDDTILGGQSVMKYISARII